MRFRLFQRFRPSPRTQRRLGRFGRILGSSPRMQVLYDQLTRVAPTSATVMLIGESGTGKELAAQTIHELSRRREGAFLPLNCGAVAPQLIEVYPQFAARVFAVPHKD